MDAKAGNGKISGLAADSYIKGDFYSEGEVRLDGVFDGNLYSEARIIIGDDAVFSGQMVCPSADIRGAVRGNIFVRDILSLASSANVRGNMHFTRFSAEAGAQVDGSLNMIEDGTYENKLKEIHC